MTQAGHPALGAFLDRLSLRSSLTEEERQAILALPYREAAVPARRDLVRPGDKVDHAILTGDGLLGRFDMMRSGARQITALYLRGDMCDLYSVPAPIAGWGITALNQATVLQVPHASLKTLATRYPNILFAFWRDTTLDASILSKWTANIGRKSARARIAHLLCEMGLRSELAGLGDRTAFELGLIQEQIGDLTGLTGVHVNRSLQTLRDADLVEFRGGRVRIPDWEGLAAVAEFTPDYLLFHEPPNRIGAEADPAV